MSADILSSVASWVLENKIGTLVAATCGLLTLRYHHFIWAVLRTLRRDLTGTFRVGGALVQLISAKTKNKTVGDAFNETVTKYPDKICFYFQDEKWSFLEAHELTNKIGNYFSSQGFQKGDVIGIFMENCPEFIPMWLGLSKIGVVPALVNTNLRHEPLKHSLEIVKCKAVIYAEDLSQAIEDLKTVDYLSVPLFSLPKAATIKHARFFMAVLDFQGYVGSATSEQKIARNVFKTGDMVFRSGDLMVMDELGYFYFKDRCGDTFRWKGENVSTTEVESVIASITQLKDCIVYGVQVQGTEGRAGMVAIVDDNANLDLENLARNVEKKLPAYARPLFLRITAQIDTTGTYKLKKMDFQKEGFDVGKIRDPIYFFFNGKYKIMDTQLYQKILSGVIRL
ncbi:unnamed protein product [Allacma fusca]|uniref:long-chain-fatty-acid--CoA ligase n=1 Tax=Allacma fusca TaxID=39272 RepID=A0A8J2KRY9_9HEXA|nr:unnamed protein product [Allacma fusca]